MRAAKLGMMPWVAARRLEAMRERWLASVTVALVLLGPAAGREARGDPGDDWGLERRADDPTLVSQRMAKLRKNPFDQTQLRALEKALGLDALRRRIESAIERNPDDVALAILSARVSLMAGEARRAAETLEAIEPRAGRWQAAVFALRIDALEQAGNLRKAVATLEARAADRTDAADQRKLLERAYELADRGGFADDALRLARKLAEARPSDPAAQLRLARAATAASEGKIADEAYAAAIAQTRGHRQDELVAERAKARLHNDNPAGASELLWSLLENPRRGTRSARESWWSTLADAHRRDGSTEVLVARLGAWLASHDETAGWRTLAQAQETAGMDSTDAWRMALEHAPRDPETQAALILALESKGDHEGAVQEYLALLERSSAEVQLGLDLATRLSAAGDHELASRVVGAIERRAGRRAHALLLLLDYYNLSDQPDQALAVARRLVSLKPRSADARIALGEQLYQMNRVQEALRQWEMLPKLVRPAHKGWARHAQVLSEHGRTADAITSLKKALKLAPHDPGYLRLRAVLAEEQRRPTMALELWEQVRKLASDPDQKLLRDEARTRMVELLVGGSISKRRTKLEGAELEARELLDRGKPLDEAIEAGRFLAELHTRRENYTAAVAVQHRLLELQPGDPERLQELAMAQRRAGQVESAMITLEGLLDADPSRTADVLAAMSELAFEAGDEQAALDAATRAAEEDRSQVDALVRLGELHERRGDIEAAAEAYDRALATTPSDARAQLRLAELELTRGDAEASSRRFRGILEAGGPPEILREAGRRALDLAEASETTMELVELAIKRTSIHPEADEPREFLLEALDRADLEDVQRWLDEAGKRRADRESALRRPLVAALTRGSIGARLRAADHLGRLRLPETAVPLAKMGAQLTAPRDATATVRDAFERARVTAIRAAGALEDGDAVPLFSAVMKDGNHTMAARRTAAWALARSGTRNAVDALVPHLTLSDDPTIVALACVALASDPRPDRRADDLAEVAALARHSRDAHVRHACAFAEAALTRDDRLAPLLEQLDAGEPVLAGIAAWRLGRVAERDGVTITALLRRFLGPPGLPRDAAGAALARLLGDAKPEVSAEVVPPPPRGEHWGTVLDRWLESRIAPRYEPLRPEAFAEHKQAVRAAVAAAERGTRAERAAAEAARRGCTEASPGERVLCLRPLVRDDIRF